ncbi:hypothetical protein J8J04_02555 ['Fragaria x ananassa' phyllody phytoplasma]|uniref:Uncharacterized protein n=1 Tax='Fragaria x ananassa' phyllody phytoplasma TaxID=2358428 RepID=A0ABS5K3R9_9MOLU|nr:hypothetical protein ['Fragaria x ananassa' phyllody phytoplasma]MBS2126556.1 hypothetical protein ['Fragaria x ananassa' phyllody phytoplasma]
MILISFIIFLLVDVVNANKVNIKDKILPLQRNLLSIKNDNNDTIINQICSQGVTLRKDGFKITPLIINNIRIPAVKVMHDDCIGSVTVIYYIKSSKPLKLEKYLKPLSTKITLSLEERKNPNTQLLLNKLLNIEDTLILDECTVLNTHANHIEVKSKGNTLRVVSKENAIFNYINTQVFLKELLIYQKLGILEDNQENTIKNAICKKNPNLVKDNLRVTQIKDHQAQVSYQECEDTITVTFMIQPPIIIQTTNLGIIEDRRNDTIVDALIVNNPYLLKDKDNLRVLKIETKKAFITINQQKEQEVTFICINPTIKKKLKDNQQNTIINALYEENKDLIKNMIKVINRKNNQVLILYDGFYVTVKFETMISDYYFYLYFCLFLLLILIITIIIFIKRRNKSNS